MSGSNDRLLLAKPQDPHEGLASRIKNDYIPEEETQLPLLRVVNRFSKIKICLIFCVCLMYGGTSFLSIWLCSGLEVSENRMGGSGGEKKKWNKDEEQRKIMNTSYNFRFTFNNNFISGYI